MTIKQQTLFWGRYMRLTCLDCRLTTYWFRSRRVDEVLGWSLPEFSQWWTDLHRDFCPGKVTDTR